VRKTAPALARMAPDEEGRWYQRVAGRTQCSPRGPAQGELEQLERAWKEAEEIARIADNLLLPDSVQRMLHGLHARVRGTTR
jgi:hypothetical protein